MINSDNLENELLEPSKEFLNTISNSKKSLFNLAKLKLFKCFIKVKLFIALL